MKNEQADLLSRFDPDVERERVFALEASEVLEMSCESWETAGELKSVVLELGRRLAKVAAVRFSSSDEGRLRVLVLEMAIVLVARVDRGESSEGAMSSARELGRRLATIARKRLSPVGDSRKK